MDKECPECGNIISPEDPKGDGVYLLYYCDNCDEYVYLVDAEIIRGE